MKRSFKFPSSSQNGVILIEALMAILIFALGILGLVGVNSLAAGAQSDAQFRSEANRLASRIVNEMWVKVDRSDPTSTNLADSLATFAHRSDVDACDTAAAGTPSGNALVTDWVSTITTGGVGGLPNATDRMQQIVVGADNQVTVTVCWRAPTDVWTRRHVVTTYIN